MRSIQDRIIRRIVAHARSISRRFGRRFVRAGRGGGGNHIHWLDYEEVIYRTFEYQYWENKAGVIPLGAYYEFGLEGGDGFSLCYKILKELTKDLGHPSVKDLGVRMYGFDSFEGMPEPKEQDLRVGWPKGSMACPRQRFDRNMDDEGVPRDIYRIVEGFYEKSLTAELRVEMNNNKPSMVMMDCGFYSSTSTVLEWLRPILRDGTIFVFIGIWSYMGHPDFGELRAIREFNNRGLGLLVPHYFGGATQQVYVFTSGYKAPSYIEYLTDKT